MKATTVTCICALAISLGVAAEARPPDFVIQFNLHEEVGVPTSDKDFLVTMGLLKDEQDGDEIGWEVQVVTIRELDGNGATVNTWSTTSPDVDTADGLWWIEHADPDSPVNSEFLVPPLIDGTAPHVNPTEASMAFSFEGSVYVAPPGGAPFSDTASLTTLLHVAGDPDPTKEEEDEPVEMPTEPVEPFPS